MGNNNELLRNLSFARADLRVDIFDTVIMQKGYKVIWEEGMFCSCMDSRSGQPDYNCPICSGKGYVYFNPKETKVIISSINGRKDQEKIGSNEQGGAYLTPLSSDNIGFRDRFTFVDFTVKFTEVVTRDSLGAPDPLKYPVESVLVVRKLGQTYQQNVDFRITEDNCHLEWINPDAVQPGESYSILTLIHPAYIAIDPIHELRGTYTLLDGGGMEKFVQLPSQYHIKREDFLEANVSY